jgi:hypothetical protein
LAAGKKAAFLGRYTSKAFIKLRVQGFHKLYNSHLEMVLKCTADNGVKLRSRKGRKFAA